ncbi:MAG: mannose-1-phosphate guanylyltransferase [Candidatus Nitrospinota bacterium M3_3B_026]
MIYNVIMAGGSGTRFWPLSRRRMPKQLLRIIGEKTMIQDTANRLEKIAPPERTLVITGAVHADEVRKQLPDIPGENIVAEPAGRNTAACVALAAMMVKKRDPEGVMAVFPADHVITRPDKFHKAVNDLLAVIGEKPESLGAIGIKPAYPETGYGYIHRGEPMTRYVYKVEKFLEKPGLETARHYADSGEHFWNSGMFFWRADAILNALERDLPELVDAMGPLREAAWTEGFEKALGEVYPSLPSISIDYGVMEKAGERGEVIVAEADPGWSDVGSWRSLYDLLSPDEEGNRKRGRLIAVDSTGVLAHNEKKIVAVVGVDDVIVVETDDAVLVLNKERAQDVRAVTDKLKELGLEEYL